MKTKIILATIAFVAIIGGSMFLYNTFSDSVPYSGLQNAQSLPLAGRVAQSGTDTSNPEGVAYDISDSEPLPRVASDANNLPEQADSVGGASNPPSPQGSADDLPDTPQTVGELPVSADTEPRSASSGDSGDSASPGSSGATASGGSGDSASGDSGASASGDSGDSASENSRASTSPESSENSGSEDSVGDRIKSPDFTVQDEGGNNVRLSDLQGKPVVLNFWASWCPPCRTEMPDFEKVYVEMGDSVHFMMVDAVDGIQETKEKGMTFIAENGFTFPTYFDVERDALTTYSIRAFPTSIFIDAEGYIIAGVEGAIDEETLRYGIDLIMP